MTTLSSSGADMGSAPAKDYPGGRPIRPDHAQRQADQLVHTGFDVDEVQAFNDDRTGTEEDMVRRRAGLLEFLDREIVDADDLDAMLDQVSRAGFAQTDIVGVEIGRPPETRVRRLE